MYMMLCASWLCCCSPALLPFDSSEIAALSAVGLYDRAPIDNIYAYDFKIYPLTSLAGTRILCVRHWVRESLTLTAAAFRSTNKQLLVERRICLSSSHIIATLHTYFGTLGSHTYTFSVAPLSFGTLLFPTELIHINYSVLILAALSDCRNIFVRTDRHSRTFAHRYGVTGYRILRIKLE